MSEGKILLGIVVLILSIMCVAVWHEKTSNHEARMACIQSEKQWVQDSCVAAPKPQP